MRKKKYDELSNELYKSCCRYDSIREGFFSRIKNGDHPIATTIAYCCVVIMILGLGIACFGHIGIGMIVSGIGAVIGLSAAFVSGEGDDGNTWWYRLVKFKMSSNEQRKG